VDAQSPPQVHFDSIKIKSLLANYLGVDAERITDEMHFRKDLDIDSLDQIELLILIEEQICGVEISDAAMEQIETVGDLIRYVEINCLFHRSAA
jgi:acyl carrier protein